MNIANKANWKLAIGLPLVIYLACFLITQSAVFKGNKELLSNAIIIDLLFTAPLAYFFVIRKSTIPKLTVIKAFVAGIIIAGLLLNTHTNAFLTFIKTVVSPLIEVLVITIVCRKFYLANKYARKSGKNKLDFLVYSRMIMRQVTGNDKAGNIIASEISVFYYAFIGRKSKAIDYKSVFTIYKENGISLVLGTFLSLFLIETAGTHFLLSLWSNTVAWVVSALSAYTCIQLFGHIKAVKARPLSLEPDSLEIHNGLAGDASVRYDNIERFELSNKMPIGRKAINIALIKGLENHNCVIYLKEPIAVTKIFGIKKSADAVLFFVDRAGDFSKSLHLKLDDPPA